MKSGARALALIGAMAFGLQSGAASAQHNAAAREACTGDYKSLCAGVMPGGGRVKKCLMENIAKLTPACRSALEAHLAKDAGGK